MNKHITGPFLLLLLHEECWALMHPFLKENGASKSFPRHPTTSMQNKLMATNLPWGVGDQWSSLSSDDSTSSWQSPEELSDPVGFAARTLEAEAQGTVGDRSYDDFAEVIDAIQIFTGDPSDPPLYDTNESLENYVGSENFAEEAAREIGLLIRCNQIPDKLLEEEGRGMRPLNDEERFDIAQLVINDGDRFENAQTTSFFNEAVSNIFQQHSVMDRNGLFRVLRADGIAKWMTTCLKDELVSKHDKRVLEVISRFSTYGTGYLTEQQFLQFYRKSVQVELSDNRRQRQSKSIQASAPKIWRDFAAHGILSPNEAQWNRKMEELAKEKPLAVAPKSSSTLIDECEILEWKQDNASPHWTIDSQGVSKLRRSSHETVDMCSDGETPKRIRDGQFVFIDEESCIGCTQCVHAAPSSFMMLDTGRARTFHQSSGPEVVSAVSACPVNCMKYISFQELKEMETVRDKGGDEWMDSKAGHIPLHVAGIESDANRKSSWYHHLKHKCFTSSSCPKKGCYDCPMYSTAGGNPYFKEKQKAAHSERLRDFLASDEANMYRKVADL